MTKEELWLLTRQFWHLTRNARLEFISLPVHEVHACRHNGVPIEGPPSTRILLWCTVGFRRPRKLVLMIPRGASHSGSCTFDRCENSTLRKLVFYLLLNWIGYDRGESFPFDFEPNGILFGKKSKGKLEEKMEKRKKQEIWT